MDGVETMNDSNAEVADDMDVVIPESEATMSQENNDDISMFYRATTSTESEEELASRMGYPKGWRVARLVPHPADKMLFDVVSSDGSCDSSQRDLFLAMLTKSSADHDAFVKDDEIPNPFSGSKAKLADYLGSSYMDQIYSGKPDSGCDAYFNHEAAMQAALKWVEGTSSCYDGKGGQLLPREPLFKADDTVEVYYEDEDSWYYANVVKVKEYLNDIRYVFLPSMRNRLYILAHQCLSLIFTSIVTLFFFQRKKRRRKI